MSYILEQLRSPWSEYQTTEVKYENRTVKSVDPYYLRERIINLTGRPVDFRVESSSLIEGVNGHKCYVVKGCLHIAGMRSSDEIGACDIDLDGKQEDAYKIAHTNCFVRACKSFGMDAEPFIGDQGGKNLSSSVKNPTKSIDAALSIATSPENLPEPKKQDVPDMHLESMGEENQEESHSSDVQSELPDYTLTPKEQDVYTDLIDKYGKSVFEGFSKGYKAEIAYLLQEKLDKDQYAVLCKKFEVDFEKYKREKGWDRISAKRCYEHYCISNGVALKKSQADIDLYLQRVENKSDAMKDLSIGIHEEDATEAKALVPDHDDVEEAEPVKSIEDEPGEDLPRSDTDLVDIWDEVEDATGCFEDDFVKSKVIAGYEQLGTFSDTLKNFFRIAPRGDIDKLISEFK